MDKYEILSVISDSSISQTFVAKRKSDGKIVFLKVQTIDGKGELSKNKRDLNPYKENIEIAATKLLSGKTMFVKFIDSFKQIEPEDVGDPNPEYFVNRYYLVTEYIKGVNMGKYVDCQIESGFVPKRLTFYRFMMALFSGLKIMHSHGIAHMDIKLENIMFDSKKLKLIDLGSSCYFRSDDEDKCNYNNFKGTPDYMSPELRFTVPKILWKSWGNNTKKITKEWYMDNKNFKFKRIWYPKCDIWSMGVVVYCVAMRKKPEDFIKWYSFNGMKLGDVVHKSIMLKPLCNYPDKKLAKIVNMCLISNPDSRPSSSKIVRLLNQYIKRKR